MIIVIRDKKLNYKKHSGLFMRWKGLRKIPQPLEKLRVWRRLKGWNWYQLIPISGGIFTSV